MQTFLGILLGWLWTLAGMGERAPDYPVVHRDGVLVVGRQTHPDGGEVHVLLRGGINRGTNYLRPEPGDTGPDRSRLATTYHHRLGPLGRVMERFNWFPDERSSNTFWADARMPASLVGLGGAPLTAGPLPAEQLAGLWSEPAVAVVGMYVGDEASYARPLQTLDFYESDPRIVRLSLPQRGAPLFRYVADARARGAEVRVFRGGERQLLEEEAPRGFYHVMVLEICPRDRLEDIAVELLTREGMAACFETLAPEGILCVHTSNRYLDTVPVIAAVADSLGYACVVGHDMAPDINGGRDPGHFSSEWVMVARRPEYLRGLEAPPGYAERAREQFGRFGGFDRYWYAPEVDQRHAWSDDSRHSLRGILRTDPAATRLGERIWAPVETLARYGVLPQRYAGVAYRQGYQLGIGIGEMTQGLRQNQTVEDLQKIGRR